MWVQIGAEKIGGRGVGPIKTPDGETFANFIRKGLVDELKLAEVYSSSSPVTLTGNLDSIDFSSTSGTWNLALTEEILSLLQRIIHIQQVTMARQLVTRQPKHS